MAMNEFGVNKSLTEYVLANYATKDFNSAEIKRTIDSAYANTQAFGTKYYEDEDKINNVKSQMRRGISKKEIRHQLLDSSVDDGGQWLLQIQSRR
jgi:hypothetical protein